ncbi:MAG: restriction endonuclease-like protein [Lysinibacillus sp.]
MSLRPSGSRNAIELLNVLTEQFELVIKGKVDYSKHIEVDEIPSMSLLLNGQFEQAFVYDAFKQQLVAYEGQNLYPIFFENGLYEIIIVPRGDTNIRFYHEYEPFRRAISKLSRTNLLTGTLHFKNEVGFSELIVQVDGKEALAVTIEVFPTKLNYKSDYRALIDEVNEEIYNLAYAFLKRTFLIGSTEYFQEPTKAEFYRLISKHFEAFMRAIAQIERQPHHQLEKQYEVVRGDRLRKQDSKTRQHMRKNASKMVEVSRGIQVAGRTVMPQSGLQVKKQVSYDTHENRYVKYTMERVLNRLLKLERALTASMKNTFYDQSVLYEEVHKIITDMIHLLQRKLRQPFWREIGKLDRSVTSLVLQMGIGYRDVYQIYMVLAKSIVLQGELYKMSVKDIATLYEYWTYLRIGRILKKHCEQVGSDIVAFSNEGLFINLQKDKTATQTFKTTKDEKVILKYQYSTAGKTPTIVQKPDSMLSIEKHGKNYMYQYIFDAKYRIEVAGEVAGPKEDDINTMHRYRDAIVEERVGGYERTAFGAYVLFPWHDEETYEQHELYKSINRVNIGGLPFLPKDSTRLVEELIVSLLTKDAEELQQQGILPIGARELFEYGKVQNSGAMLVAEDNIN